MQRAAGHQLNSKKVHKVLAEAEAAGLNMDGKVSGGAPRQTLPNSNVIAEHSL